MNRPASPPGAPLVTVIFLGRPSEPGYRESFRSLLGQTFQRFECLVVELAGPHGEHVELPGAAAAPERIRYVRAATPGLAAAKNAGLEAARGVYVAYLEAPDRYCPGHLETLVGAMQDHAIAYTDAWLAHISRAADREGPEVLTREAFPAEDFDPERLLVRSPINLSSVMHHRDCVRAAGGFDEALQPCEDWDLWVRLADRYAPHHLREATCEICLAVERKPAETARLVQALKAENRLRAKHRGLLRGRDAALLYLDYSARVNLLLELGAEEAALEAMADLAQHEPSHGGARRDLAYLCSFHGDVARGVEVLRRPGGPALERGILEQERAIVELLARQGRVDEARVMQEALLAAHPEDAHGYNNLGVLAWTQGQMEKAYALLRLAAELEPHCLEAQRNLAQLSLAVGNTAQAARHCRRALELDASDAEAQRLALAIERQRQAAASPPVQQSPACAN